MNGQIDTVSVKYDLDYWWYCPGCKSWRSEESPFNHWKSKHYKLSINNGRKRKKEIR